jgi:hypothetical protein
MRTINKIKIPFSSENDQRYKIIELEKDDISGKLKSNGKRCSF